VRLNLAPVYYFLVTPPAGAADDYIDFPLLLLGAGNILQLMPLAIDSSYRDGY